MSLHELLAIGAALVVLIAAACAIDWRWLPNTEPEERRRLNALACDEDLAFHLRDREVKQ